MPPVDLTILIPAYNEEKRLGPSIESAIVYYSKQTYSWEIVVVSDGSKDGTNALVETYSNRDSRVKLLAYEPNAGKGHAVRYGMLRAEGSHILFMDADLATPLEETDKLLKVALQGKPIAIGSRPLKESSLEVHQSFLREAFGRLSNKLVQILAVKGINDTQCGFKIFENKVAKDVFSRCKLNGFSFDFEALMIARDLGYEIEEIPIRWAHQEGSKVTWVDYPKALRDLIKLRLMGKSRRLSPNAS